MSDFILAIVNINFRVCIYKIIYLYLHIRGERERDGDEDYKMRLIREENSTNMFVCLFGWGVLGVLG